MPISWNEVHSRALAFAKEWEGETREDAEAKSFWDAFFRVFGLERRHIASFEEPVKNIRGKYSYIDLFWTGHLLVEHKSAGKSLEQAESQACQYIQDLIAEGRKDECPRYLIISDFEHIVLHDLEPEDGKQTIVARFLLADFPKHVRLFGFVRGEKVTRIDPEDPANIKAAEIMGDFHDALKKGGYEGHDLERFLVRILFCLFADDTGVFEPNAFQTYLKNHTQEDGSDLGAKLNELFEVLDTPEDKRQKNLDEDLAAFRYINGRLFEEHLKFAAFNKEMWDELLNACHFDWSRISPAVFGSLFQAVMEPKERRQTGGHYTSERDILKVIKPLFLDALWEKFERVKKSKTALKKFHEEIAALRFLDPACGCGNFLVISYRELRLLEIEILKALHKGQRHLDISQLSRVDVDVMHGIEISEFPTRIAEVALWLTDHQMNQRLSEALGLYFVRLPLQKNPTIVCANALRHDWKQVLSPAKCSYVLGNPPFVGKKARNAEQQADMEKVFGEIHGSGVLDYVCCWYLRAAQYIKGTSAKVAFVSTNSISQGEQPGVLWAYLFKHFGLKIQFAYRTFAWESEARGKAHVHVVIIGFGNFDVPNKLIYECSTDGEKITTGKANNISPYLIQGNDTVLENREKPVCNVPEIQFGSMPNDDGQFLFADDELKLFLKDEPKAKEFIRPLLSAHEYLHGENRWCLWLKDIPPKDIREAKRVHERVEAVRKYRSESKREATRKLADFPTIFGENRQPDSDYVLIPRHSSETRRYIPISYFDANFIISDSCLFVAGATTYHFGILSSSIHMAWVRQVCGRLESRYRYSNKLVYNNFPWPESPSEKQRRAVEKAAESVLTARKKYPTSTLADLYDPLAMPPDLVKAHAALDRAVEICYRRAPFKNDRQRVEFLFSMYEKIIASKEQKKK